jgi:hypothetical protein
MTRYQPFRFAQSYEGAEFERLRGTASSSAPRAAQLAGRLNDPDQHRAAGHLITAGGSAKAQDVISTLQGIEQAAHPRGDTDRGPPATAVSRKSSSSCLPPAGGFSSSGSASW